MKNKFVKPELDMELDSASYYNQHQIEHAKDLLSSKLTSRGPAPQATASAIADFGGTSSPASAVVGPPYTFNGHTFRFKVNAQAKVGKGEVTFVADKSYTPFMILGKLKFGLNFDAASTYVEISLRKLQSKYVRVGVDYFKEIVSPDRYELERKELKRWKKDEIKEDHGKDALKEVRKYDSFVLEPNNEEYAKVLGNSYNLYNEFTHKPKPGKFPWSEEVLRNVFGEQYELGLKYMQTLYLHPKQALPILVLASTERITGKTTFLNWLMQLFGANYTTLNPDDITGAFNGSYALKNVISIEETTDERLATVNKIKNIATQKYLTVNEKYIGHYGIPFFGKLLVATNEPTRFLKVDDEEVRFWVRILKRPATPKTDIEDALVKEIPAFLHHLKSLPPLDFSRSRMVFTPEEIETDALQQVKEESWSWLRKDLEIMLEEHFEKNPDDDSLELNLSEIKDEFFQTNQRANVSYIRKVLQDEMGLETTLKKYTPPHLSEIKTGRVYTFYRNLS